MEDAGDVIWRNGQRAQTHSLLCGNSKTELFEAIYMFSLYIQHRPLIALAAFAHGIDFTCPVVGLSEMRGLLLPKNSLSPLSFPVKNP
jgi:hypothetical protein